MTHLTEAQTEIVLAALSEGIAAAIDREFRAADETERRAHEATCARYVATKAALQRQVCAAEVTP